MNDQPPKHALKFLRWFCREDYLEEIEGNLIELYEKQNATPDVRANRNFYWNVLLHFRPDYIRSLKGDYPLNHYDMFKNYFKIAWRSMLKQKLYSFINIGGLAIGLSCFILILLYIQHELSFDRSFQNADQIYRIYQRQKDNMYMGTDYFAVTPAGLAGALKEEYPEVAQATSVKERFALLGKDKEHYWEEGLLADPHFFEIFSFSFLQGDPEKSLKQAESIVLTQSLAKKIFGNKNPIGQSLSFQNDKPYIVTGLIEDPPTNISFQFSFVASILSDYQYEREVRQEKWNNNAFHTFISLSENKSPKELQNKLSAVFKKHSGHDETYPFQDSYYLQTLSELHLTNHVNFDIGLKGNSQYISLFSLIAALILILACVNYMNLAIARSIRRAKEVGLRKVIGARRRQLIWQFIGESILVTSLALLLALGLVQILAPLFSYLLERPIELDFVQNVYLVPGLLGLVFIVGLLSGSYPALFMSSLRPAQVLKGKIEGRFSGMNIQRWLTVGKYAISIALIISSMVIYRQFQFIQNKKLGYDREHIVTIPLRDYTLRNNIELLKSEWLKKPQIQSVTISTSLPTNITSNTIINDEAETTTEDDIIIYELRGDYDLLHLFGVELVAGRNFSPEVKKDPEEGYIINETAAAALGWTPAEAIGKNFTHQGTETVIGVVKDFHMHSMHMAIKPLMIRLDQQYFNYLSVKVLPHNLKETLNMLEASFKDYSPYPFEYQFLDEKFDELYKADLRLGEMFGFFTILSILIASLGLFGLAAFTTAQRTKEIGIRKVLGASAKSIVSLLSKDFLKMVLIGFLLAIPTAWYVMRRWLQDFAYSIGIEWQLFVIAGLSVVVFAFLTVSSQSLKAVFANPVEALKNE